VLVSSLLGSGADLLAIRLALLARHDREDWEWTDAAFLEAHRRLERWTA